jgi:hypothetical protein
LSELRAVDSATIHLPRASTIVICPASDDPTLDGAMSGRRHRIPRTPSPCGGTRPASSSRDEFAVPPRSLQQIRAVGELEAVGDVFEAKSRRMPANAAGVRRSSGAPPRSQCAWPLVRGVQLRSQYGNSTPMTSRAGDSAAGPRCFAPIWSRPAR